MAAARRAAPGRAADPSFAIDPWYADNPTDSSQQEETFMATELAPWVKANLATSGTEQSWLIGFFKSGIGAQDLLLKHPDLFTLANFQANYRLTQALMTAREAPFTARSPSRRSPPTASTSTADGGF